MSATVYRSATKNRLATRCPSAWPTIAVEKRSCCRASRLSGSSRPDARKKRRAPTIANSRACSHIIQLLRLQRVTREDVDRYTLVLMTKLGEKDADLVAIRRRS